MRCFLLMMVLILIGRGTGYAQEKEMDNHAPADVQATMRSGGISLRFGEVPIGPKHQKILLHIYAVPKSRLDDSDPHLLRRDDIIAGTSLSLCPFYADLPALDHPC
ncbi:MAG: hypothetical protein JWL77_6451 [Chthonomonadaceae bacterium]|nr:hypothetical protein [Chthonomonadaceae bacterium]